jgi:hypothetical protein
VVEFVPVERWNKEAIVVRAALMTMSAPAGICPEIAEYPLNTKMKTSVQNVRDFKRL